MTLSDADEILPLIDHNRRDQEDSNVDYRSLLRSSKEQSSVLSRDRPPQCFGNVSESRSQTASPHDDSSDKKITYSWNNLNVYHVIRNTKRNYLLRRITNFVRRRRPVVEQRKQILENVYGIAYPGELLAIMGASGAGKTTLLNALTFQSGPDCIVKGSRCLNGVSVIDRNSITELSAYVEQDNLFIGTLTVKEHLIFHSLVRIDRSVPYQKKLKRVEDVISELGLEKCQNTVIGYEGRTKGISGGEKKRLSFASEILTNPPIMFCDEPTSGLDSFMALNVINVLKSMAIRGKTVICTIHQPSSEIFSLFDKILLLAEGRTAFLGGPNEAISFFNELGASTPANYNPADFFIQLLAVIPNQEENCKRNIKFICDFFDQSTQGLEIVSKIDSETRTQFLKRVNSNRTVSHRRSQLFVTTAQKVVLFNGYIQPNNFKDPVLGWKLCDLHQIEKYLESEEKPKTVDVRLNLMLLKENGSGWRRRCTALKSTPEHFTYPATWLSQFRALFWRSWMNTIKEPILVKVRLFQTVVLSLIVGLIYHGQKLNEDGVMNINGVLFTFLTNMTFQNLFAVISVFCSELPVFLKEQSIRLYRVDTYFLSKTLAEIPVFLAIPITFTCITYYWINLNSALYHFALTVLILILVTNVATSFGYFISCISTNVVMALSIGPPVIIPFLLFGGFLLNAGAIPAYFKWLSYLSWFKYGNEALLINQWSDIKNIECNMSAATCPRNGEIVLEVFHFEKDNFWWDLGALVLLILLFRSLAFLALLLKAKRHQRR